MNTNQILVNVIIEAAESLDLEAYDHHFSGHGPDMYNVGIYDFRKEIEMFEFYLYEGEADINYNLLVDLGERKISNRLADEILSYFANEKVIKEVTISKDDAIVAIKGSLLKDQTDESQIKEILTYYKSIGPALQKLLVLVRNPGSDNKSMY